MDGLYFCVFVAFFISLPLQSQTAFNLTIIHTNDIHAHFEEMNTYSGSCKPADAQKGKCFGGVARRVTMINKLKKMYPNHILLDAGDQFQGTLWFNIYKGLAASRFMDEIGYDAMTFGNHEFDNGVPGLLPFVHNLSFPIINCNIDAAKQPELQKTFEKSVVLTVAGEKIGVIGYTTAETPYISNPGHELVFNDVIPSVAAEIKRLQSLGINKIIGLGHNGYGNDQKLARNVDGLDVIVGGHTHTFLYTGTQPSTEKPEGPYPTIVTKDNGDKTLIVQDYWSGKYLGFINIIFDDMGKVTSWHGEPILLDNSVEKDNATQEEVNRMKEPLKAEMEKVIGSSVVYLEGDGAVCRIKECNLGNLITDGMVDYFIGKQTDNDSWSLASIAIMNSGGIRAPMDSGNITNGDLLTTMPFGNSVDVIAIKGKYLRQAFEHSVENYDIHNRAGAFLQVSGIHVVYDMCKAKGQRVKSLRVRCRKCKFPEYSDLDDDAVYQVASLDFTIKGGDGYTVLKNNNEKWYHVNALDTDVFKKYLNNHVIVSGVEDRIVLDFCGNTSSGVSRLPSSSQAILIVLCLLAVFV